MNRFVILFLLIGNFFALGKIVYPGTMIPYWDMSPNASFPVMVGTIDTNTVLIWRITEGIHGIISCDENFVSVNDPDNPYFFPSGNPVGPSTDGKSVSIERRFKIAGDYYFKDAFFPNTMHGNVTVINATKELKDDSDDGESNYEEALIVFNRMLSWIVFFLLVISIVGASCVIITFSVFKDIRTFPIKLIMYLCWCIILGNVSFLFAFEGAFYENEYLCYIIGMAVHGFFLANFCWTLSISWNFFQMIVQRNRNSEKLEGWYHLFSWGFPIACIMWTSAFLEYGDRGGVCYITSPVFVFLFFFMPGLIIISLNAILFFFVVREIHETLSTAPKTDKREAKKELRVYLSIFITVGLSWIFGFLMVLFQSTLIRLVFLVLFSITTPMQGFLIFLFYCANPKVFGKWAGLFGRCVPYLKHWEELDSRSGTSSGTSTCSRNSLKSANTSFRTSTDSMSTRSNLWDSDDDEEYLLGDPEGFVGVDTDEEYLIDSSSFIYTEKGEGEGGLTFNTSSEYGEDLSSGDGFDFGDDA